MEALNAALKPAMTDIEVSWHLPEGYDVIQSPCTLPFIFDGERLVLYGILSRPPDVDRESPKTPQKRRLDNMMRSFSNNSVKVFWFDDDMEYLPEEQLLFEIEEQDRVASQETICEYDDDVFNQPQIGHRETSGRIDSASNRIDLSSERIDSSMKKVDSKSELIDSMSGRIDNMSENCGGTSEKFGNSLAVANDDLVVNTPTPLTGKMDDKTQDIVYGTFFKELNESCRSNEMLDCTKNGQQMSNSTIMPGQSSQMKRQKFASERLSEQDPNCFRKTAKDVDEETAYQHSSRYHERDSGVGFSLDDGDNNENADILSLKPGITAPRNSLSTFDDFVKHESGKIHIFKNSDLLGSIGVPKNFAAVGIKGFVGDEEVEQVSED